MTDLAMFDIGARSDTLETANKRLDDFAGKVARADQANDNMSASSKRSGSALGSMVASINRNVAELVKLQRAQQQFVLGMAEGAAAALREAKAIDQVTASTTRLSTATQRLPQVHKQAATATKLQAHEVANLNAQIQDIGVSLAGGASPFLVLSQQGGQIAQVFKGSGLALRSFATAMAGSVASMLPMVAVIGAISVAVDFLVKKVTEASRRKEELATRVAALRAEMQKTVPALNDNANSTGLAEDALKNFDAWVQRGTQSLADYAKNAKAAGVAALQFQALQAGAVVFAMQGANTRRTARGTVYTGGGGSEGRAQYLKDLASAQAAVTEANKKLAAAVAAPTKAFVEQEKAVRKVKDTVDEYAEIMGEVIRLQKEGAAAANAYAREMANRPDLGLGEARQNRERDEAKAAMGREVELALLREQQGLAKSYSERLRLSEAIRAAEREQELATKGYSAILLLSAEEMRQAQLQAGFDDLNDSLSRAAGSFKQGDWGGAVAGILNAMAAFKQAALSGAGKLGAVAGAASAIGGAIGGTAGSALTGAASGAMAGFTLGGPVGAAIGGILGGIGGLISGSKAKKAEQQQKAAAAAQEAANKAMQVANEKRSLEIALLEASGDTVGALAARRADELAAMDPTNRAMAERIYALQDEADAATKAARAADEAAAAAAELAERAADLASQYRDREITLLRLQGNAMAALNMEREDELAALDDSLRAIQKAIYLAQDLAQAQDALAAANDNVAAAAANLADLQQQAANRAAQAFVDQLQQAASDAQDIASGLASDNAAAIERVEAAQSALAAAREREAGALTATIDRLRSFADTVREFRESLTGGAGGSAAYGSSKSAFFGLAAQGPAADADKLIGAAQTFLDASGRNARSALDVARDRAAVAAALKVAENAAGAQANIAQQQLDALNSSVDGLLDINDSVLSVQAAIQGLATAQAGQAQAQLAADSAQASALASMAQAQAAAAQWAAQQASQQASAQAATLAAAQAALDAALAARNSASNDVARLNPAQGADWDSYMRHYPDVQAEWDRIVSGEMAKPAWASAANDFKKFASLHFENFGKNEGRTPYAMGGAFNGPVGDILSRETYLGAGRVGGEAGWEAIMPLERGPDGKLGVRAGGANDDDAADEIRMLRTEVAGLRIELQAIARHTAATSRSTSKTADMLDAVTQGGDTVRTTEIAA